MVESLLATLSRRDLLEEAVERWGEIVEAHRPEREQELVAVEAQIRRAQVHQSNGRSPLRYPSRRSFAWRALSGQRMIA